MAKRAKLVPAIHPGRLLRRELEARNLSASRLATNLGVQSGRITGILNGRRSITADTALRLARHFGNNPQFWLDFQSQYDIAMAEREGGAQEYRMGKSWRTKRNGLGVSKRS